MKKQLKNTSMFASTKSAVEIIKDLEPGLEIDPNDLDRECQQHAVLFNEVADALTFALSRRDEAKMILNEVEAAVELDIRKRIPKGRGEKPTNPEIAAMVTIEERVREAKRQHLRFSNEAARLAALKESYEQRSYQLSQMVKLYLKSYFGDVTGTVTTSQLKQDRAEHIRGELHRMRTGER